MEPYALGVRAGVGGPRAGWGQAVSTQGPPACQDPTQTHCQAEYKGDLGQSPVWPTQEGGTGCARQSQANASPSMVSLYKVSPSGQTEGTISGACFLRGGHHPTETAPACSSENNEVQA